MRRHPADRIIAAAAHVAGADLLDVLGRFDGSLRRDPAAVVAREIAAYLLHRQGWGRPEIARSLAETAHSSVYHMIRRARERIAADPAYGLKVDWALLLADVWREAEPFAHRWGVRVQRHGVSRNPDGRFAPSHSRRAS